MRQVAEYAGEDADVAWRLCAGWSRSSKACISRGLAADGIEAEKTDEFPLYDDLECRSSKCWPRWSSPASGSTAASASA